MSFLKIGDRAAGAIKSGGTTRRAAKMVIVDIDHPDVELVHHRRFFAQLQVDQPVRLVQIRLRDRRDLLQRNGYLHRALP